MRGNIFQAEGTESVQTLWWEPTLSVLGTEGRGCGRYSTVKDAGGGEGCSGH